MQSYNEILIKKSWNFVIRLVNAEYQLLRWNFEEFGVARLEGKRCTIFRGFSLCRAYRRYKCIFALSLCYFCSIFLFFFSFFRMKDEIQLLSMKMLFAPFLFFWTWAVCLTQLHFPKFKFLTSDMPFKNLQVSVLCVIVFFLTVPKHLQKKS